jgi:outer membrane cobalamin receptor
LLKQSISPVVADQPMAPAPLSKIKSSLSLAALSVTLAYGQSPELLPPITVLAERQLGDQPVAPLAEWDREDIRLAAPRTIDEMLAKEPSFSLYRRQSSISSNPTSAGVSLRNTGATAASRTLVLLDGIPQNDPFGGWVYWARYDAATLDSIRIVSAARAAVWGNQSPAGVIQMNGYPAFDNFHVLKTGGGSQGTISGSTVNQMTNEDKTLAVLFSAFGLHTDGFFAVDSSQRGPVDRKLDTDLYGANLKFSWLAAPGLTVEPAVSWYAEERGNGTALSKNSTDAVDLSLRVSSADGDFSWQALAWHQQREFESTFSSVNADRTAETLALDQFDVPADATGAAFTTLWDSGGKWTVSSGADAKMASGETNENVGTFRRREAGGDQSLAGLFTAASYQADERTRLDASIRLDWWELSDGRRNETSLTTGKPLRADTQDDRDGWEPSASLESSHQIDDSLLGRISAGTAFRLPTLNELHRPFRVRNDIVEANPDLDPERFFSISGGLDWTPTDTVTVNATLFQHWIKDAIANVPVTAAAPIKEIFGTIPPGGSGSQRQNVEQAQVTGIEGKIEWLPVESVTLGLTGLWSRTDFTKSPEQPLLEGKPFPQAPDLRLIASATWQATERWSFFAGGEYGASQYDDALASRSIPSFTTARIGAQWQIGRGIYQIRIENLSDEDIQTGLSSDGIRTYAGPRSLWIGAEWNF